MRTIRNTLLRISTISFRRLFDCIDLVHRDSKKAKLYIFLDMILCYIRYGTGYLDYLTFGFVHLKAPVRKTYMSMNKNLALVRRLNNPDYRAFIDDKSEFNRLFSDLLGRDWIDLRKTDSDSFLAFVEKHKVVYAKPTLAFGGKGIRRIEYSNQKDSVGLYDELVSLGIFDVEEQIVQHPRMSLLSGSSVNSLRITTLLVDSVVSILYTLVRIGDGSNYVDNISSGGMYCPVDDNGIISADAFCDAKVEYYENHPKTATKFKGFLIPLYEEAIALVKKAALRIPEIRYIGWDVAITEDKPVLIEGNVIPGYDMPQNYRHLGETKVGILPKIHSILKDELTN